MISEFVFMAYAAVAYYFVACNIDSFSNLALSGLAKVPQIGQSEAFAKVSHTVRQVLLPQRSARVALASAVSLFAYPLVSLASKTAEAFTYALGFAVLLYLSLSQNANALEIVRGKLEQLIALVKAKTAHLQDAEDDTETVEVAEEQ